MLLTFLSVIIMMDIILTVFRLRLNKTALMKVL